MGNRPQRLLAEFLGTLLLTTVVVGSGIAAQRLSPGDRGLELTESAMATALGLIVIITIFVPISGAHLNPVVSLADAALGRRRWSDAALYIPVQVIGCGTGAALANVMFGTPAVQISSTARLTPAHFLSEIVATAGLILLVFLLALSGNEHLTAITVGAYIGAAYLFSSSTGFANPAITVGRMFSDTFARHRAGIGTRVHRCSAHRRGNRPDARACSVRPRDPHGTHGTHDQTPRDGENSGSVAGRTNP